MDHGSVGSVQWAVSKCANVFSSGVFFSSGNIFSNKSAIQQPQNTGGEQLPSQQQVAVVQSGSQTTALLCQVFFKKQTEIL
jgi:hypothetical protein